MPFVCSNKVMRVTFPAENYAIRELMRVELNTQDDAEAFIEAMCAVDLEGVYDGDYWIEPSDQEEPVESTACSPKYHPWSAREIDPFLDRIGFFQDRTRQGTGDQSGRVR